MIRYPIDGMIENTPIKILPKVENQIWFGSEEDQNTEMLAIWFWTKFVNTAVKAKFYISAFRVFPRLYNEDKRTSKLWSPMLRCLKSLLEHFSLFINKFVCETQSACSCRSTEWKCLSRNLERCRLLEENWGSWHETTTRDETIQHVSCTDKGEFFAFDISVLISSNFHQFWRKLPIFAADKKRQMMRRRILYSSLIQIMLWS